jgi:hypothetical protein
MVWTESIAVIWSALFVVCSGIVTRNQDRPSRVATAAQLFAAVSVLALLGVALRGYEVGNLDKWLGLDFGRAHGVRAADGRGLDAA